MARSLSSWTGKSVTRCFGQSNLLLGRVNGEAELNMAGWLVGFLCLLGVGSLFLVVLQETQKEHHNFGSKFPVPKDIYTYALVGSKGNPNEH